ncbi:hypothetical protein BaRGS_00015933 [Batillaria attramentaria]|uniref:Myb-like domain-containing protein n=1 Tax=Batillaria attramentaria TaxID=370345 RepID=A0ABD0L0A1_9CAEN
MERQRSSPSCAVKQKRTGHSSQHHPQKKRPWSKEEVSAVHKHLSQCIIMNRVPQKHEVERALAAEPALRKRKWKDVKYFVYNLLNKKRKANKHM